MTTAKEMFVPSNRNEWTSLVRPPDGYRFHCAIGTTFGLDFTALTALLLAMLDQPAGEAAWEQHARRLQAITTLDERVRVLVHRSQIHGDIRPSNRVFTLLDRIIDEVHLENVAFHPKVWVLKYVPRQPVDLETRATRKKKEVLNDSIYRFLCTSRNLTIYSSWEAVTRLDGYIANSSESESTSMGREVASFFVRSTQQSEPLPPALKELLRELPRVAFATVGSKSVQSCKFLWQWPGGRPLIESVDPDGRIALIVSPFLRVGFLKELAGRFKRILVISRQEELDRFWNESIEKLIPRKYVWVVKPDAAEEDTTEGVTVQSLDLHAKLLFCEYGRRGSANRTEVWLGSSNASPRGWGSTERLTPMNCEAMIRFTPGIRPEQFLEQFAYRPDASESEKENPVLNGWIEPYNPRSPDPEKEEERVDRVLDAARKALASLDLIARLDRSGESVDFVLRGHDQSACRSLFSDYMEIGFHAVPLGLAEGSESRFADLYVLVDGNLRFENLSISEIGTMLLVQLTHRPSSRQKRFVIQIDLDVEEGFWAERRTAFLRANLSPSDFRLFLRSILFDGATDPGTFGGEEGGEKGTRGSYTGAHAPTLLDDMSVEDILHACTQDRSRIDEVDRLLKMFEGTKHVDTQFRTFWDNFRKAMRATETGKHR